MQSLDINWTVFSWSLAAAFTFGVLYAGLVRWVSTKHLIGQTAWSVVIGVAATLIVMVPVFGIERVALIFCFFAASGLPMVVEYLSRVQIELQRDRAKANELAKELLNDREAADR